MTNDIGGVWRTIGGRKVFIKAGQNLADAMRESGKFKKQKPESLNTFEKQIEYIKENQDELYNIIETSENIDKELCLKFQERNQFNAKPAVLNSEEFEKLSSKDYIKVYRGYHDGKKKHR